MRGSMVLVAAILLVGPAPIVAAPKEAGAETITYTPGCGLFPCRDYTFSVSSDGAGWFVGRRGAAVRGRHSFRVAKAALAAFRQRLTPYRPARELLLDHPPLCRVMSTDQESIDIRWTGKGGSAHLSAYYGCDMEKNDRMFAAIRSAPKLLPQVARLIGWR